MIAPPALPLALCLTLAPAMAAAAPIACWYEHGVIVVPANVAGAAGDYILDTGAPRTELHDTRAQGMGLNGDATQGEVDIGGFRFPDRSLAIVSQDARTYAFPTPIAGVIGADVLKAVIVEVDFQPCRVELHAPADGPAPKTRSEAQDLQWVAGRPLGASRSLPPPASTPPFAWRPARSPAWPRRNPSPPTKPGGPSFGPCPWAACCLKI